MLFKEANRVLNEKGFYVRNAELDGCGNEYFFYLNNEDQMVYIEVELLSDHYSDINQVPPGDLGKVVLAEFDNTPFSWESYGTSHVFEQNYNEIITLAESDIDKYFEKCIDLKDRESWPAYYISLKEAEIKKFNFISMILPILREYEVEMDEDDSVCTTYEKSPTPLITLRNQKYGIGASILIVDVDLMTLQVRYKINDEYWTVKDLSQAEVDRFEERFMEDFIQDERGEIKREFQYLFNTDLLEEDSDTGSVRDKSLGDTGRGWIGWM